MICVVMVAGVGTAIGQLKIVVVRMAIVRVSTLKSTLSSHYRVEIRLVCPRRGERKQKNADHRHEGGAKIGKSAFLSKQHKGREY